MMTATAPATTTDPKVHVEVPDFTGYGEFHGSTVDCSADAELMARAPLDGSPLDATTLNLWWADYTATGHGDAHGATLAGIYWHLTQSAHKLDAAKARIARYLPIDTISIADLRTALIAALTAGQTVIVYLGNAQALTYNERGVYGHFVALGGIDSDQGYLVGNGDDVNALGGHGIIPARWYGWNMLAAAAVNGMIAVERVTTVGNTTIPSGWSDDGTTLVAPNKVAVAHGFRAFVLAYPGGWEGDNWPLAAEAYRDASVGGIEPGNKYIGRGSRQDFRYRSLGCPQAADGSWKPVYRIWTGQDIVALESQLASETSQANTHIAQLEQQVTALTAQVTSLQQQLAQGGDPTAHAAIVALASALAALGSAASQKAA